MTSLNNGEGATLLSRQGKSFGGIGLVKLLRYYGTKALRSNSRISKPDLQHVILNCLSPDNILDIGQPINVIPHLLRDLNKKRSRNVSGMTEVSCHPEAIAEGSQKTQPRPRISKFARLTKKFNLRPQGVGVSPLSEARGNHKPHLTHSTHSKKLLVPYCLSNLVSSKKAAFTLAEVLITLAIIGIVAAMTIPTLVSNYKQKVLNNQFKKTYAMLNEALLNAQSQLGYFPNCYYSVDNSFLVFSGCAELSDKFWTLFKVSKICDGKAFERGCIPEYEGMDTVLNANNPDAEVPDGYEDYGDYASIGCGNFRKNAILNDRTVYVLFGRDNYYSLF